MRPSPFNDNEWVSSQALKAAKLVDQAWVAGFGLALSEVHGYTSQPVAVEYVCKAAGLDMTDFRKAGLDEYDLKRLRQCLATKVDSHPRAKRSKGKR